MIEKVFGHWKHDLGFLKFLLRGLSGAWVETFFMAASTLRRLCKILTRDEGSWASLAPFTVGGSVPCHFYVDAELGDDSNDGSEGALWRTITHALDSVEGAEGMPITVHVNAGTYSASTNGETFPLIMKSWVSLCGEDRNTTIFDAENEAYHVILCIGVKGLTIEGLTITAGIDNGGSWFDNSGGGICCRASFAEDCRLYHLGQW